MDNFDLDKTKEYLAMMQDEYEALFSCAVTKMGILMAWLFLPIVVKFMFILIDLIHGVNCQV